MRSNVVTVLLALVAGFAGGILSQHAIRPAQAAAAVQPVVSARAFRLVDSSGKLLAQLAPVAYDKSRPAMPMLVIYGTGGQQADIHPDGLFFGHGYGKADLGVGYTDTESPAIYFWHHGKGRMGMMLDASHGGAPSAWMYDASGKTLWKAP